jgi:nucleoid-associated protein YgaU
MWVIGIFLVFISYGCTPPPTQELADAEAALSAAREAGAERFAAQEYESAESKLEEARMMNERKDYLEAKDMAIEARDIALLAKSIAEEARIKLREQARETLDGARQALLGAEMAGAEKYDPEDYRSLEALFAEADTAYSVEEYPIAIQKAEEVIKRARRLELAAKRAAELEKEEEKEPEEEIEEPQIIQPETIYDSHLVQKGECLWIISEYEKIYADPFKWPLIYRSNRSQINDPDLIFPGQNLAIPRNSDPSEIEDAINSAKNRGPWSLFDGK